jgi:L-seryl-tRNA(Ser) seleniumtransferase
LIEAAAANANPNQFLGRPMKVAKEEIVGLVTALEAFVAEDEEAETQEYHRLVQQVVDALTEVPGLDISLEHDEFDYLIPTAVIKFTRHWRGPSRDQVTQAMKQGDPPVYLHELGNPDELAVDPLNLRQDEVQTVVRRLREELLR